VRILVMHSRYASGSSSGENRVVDDEVALLRGAGHDVELWSPGPATGASGMELGASAVWSRNAVRELRRFEAEQGADVIHVHNLFPLVSPAVLRAARAPVVMTLHNYRLLCLPANFLRDGQSCERCLGRGLTAGVLHGCYRGSRSGSAALAASITLHRSLRTFDRVAAFLAVSDFVRQKYLSAGFDPDRVWVKPNFVPATAVREGPGEDFLYLGRISVEKGLDRLVKLWGEVPGRLVVIGDGPLLDAARAAAPPNVEFRPPVAPEHVPGLLRRARALVVPSICYEGAPRTVVEAFAAGVPVIGHRIGAIGEVVQHERTGLLVDVGSAAGWRAAVDRLADDGESCRMGELAHDEWQRHFGPEHAAELLERFYNRVVGRAVDTGSTALPEAAAH
jgi:glycosyltransferase involved in cell wall biosynthesis